MTEQTICLPLGEGALLIRFPVPSLERVSSLFFHLEKLNPPFLLNLHPAYASLLIEYDPLKISFSEVRELCQGSLETLKPPLSNRTIGIPVCYGGDYGPDLKSLAESKNLAPDEIVKLHSQVTYSVSFLGFQPGFAYLSGLLEALQAPRLVTPRPRVFQGSVGIAGRQTGIYPLATPGGWQIIGRTPLKLFRPEEPTPTLLLMGDSVRFYPVSDEEFRNLKEKNL